MIRFSCFLSLFLLFVFHVTNSQLDETCTASSLQLIIGSHQRLFLHDVETGKHHTIHAGSGTYYGVFPSDEPGMYWVNLRGTSESKDFLLEINLHQFLSVSKKIYIEESHFTHEVIRFQDKLFVADTSTGEIDVVSFPSLKLIRKLGNGVFTRKHHINTLSLVENGTKIWATYHNQNEPSIVSLFNIETGEILEKLTNVGNQVHSWVEYGADERIYLSSADASLMSYNLKTKEKTVLYRSPRHMKPKMMFLKGLAIVNHIAYFGESELKDRKGRETVNCRLVAFDLKNKKTKFDRAIPGSIGLINTITIPYRIDGTYRAQEFSSQFPSLDDSIQCNGVNEEYNLVEQAKLDGYAYGTFPDDVDIVRLPFLIEGIDLALQEVFQLAEVTQGWVSRPDVNNYFVLLVTQNGVYNDQSNVGPFLPVPNRLSNTPKLRQLMRKLGVIVGRTRLMLIRAGESVKVHVDQTNHYNPRSMQPDVKTGYWGRRFRIHVPIKTTPKVKFTVGASVAHFELGGCYVFDNAKYHSVENPSNEERIHLVIDTVGSPRLFKAIRDGQIFSSNVKKQKKKEQVKFEKINLTENDEFENSLIYENWVDSPVFTSMPPQQVHDFLIGYLLKEFVQEKDKQNVKLLFEEFLKVYSLSSSPVLMDVWHDLLFPSFCSNIVLKNAITLWEAVEPFVRMIHFTCSKHDEKDFKNGPYCTAKPREKPQ